VAFGDLDLAGVHPAAALNDLVVAGDRIHVTLESDALDILPNLERLIREIKAPGSTMPQVSRAPIQLTDDAILAAARRFLRPCDSLYFAPHVPASKEKNLREAYGTLIAAHEPVLVLFDDTVFGAGDDGFVITSQRLGWKNDRIPARTLTWDELATARLRVVAEASNLLVADGRIRVTYAGTAETLLPDLEQLIRALVA
jgi:hypothetical protein